MSKLIGVMGAAGSGKDAVAGFLRGVGWASVAFADPLKKIVRDTWGISSEVLWGPSELRSRDWWLCSACLTVKVLDPEDRWECCCPTCNEPECMPMLVRSCPECGGAPREDGSCESCNYPETFVQTLSARLALQRLGTEGGRWLDKDVWARLGVKRAKGLLGAVPPFAGGGPLGEHRAPDGTMWPGIMAFESDEEPVLKGTCLSDCRFANETRLIRAAGGVIWQVVRPGLESDSAEAWRNHDSETKSAEITPDVVLANDSTLEALKALVREHLG